MLKNLLFTLAFFSIVVLGHAQAPSSKGHTFKFKITGVKDTTVFLAHYYGNKLYYADTTKADSKGTFQFGPKKKFEPGMYAVVVSGKYFDLIVNNEDISIETTKADLQNKVVVKASKENKLFYDYVHFLTGKRSIIDPLKKKMNELKADDPELAKVKAEITAVDNDVKAYQQKMKADNPGSLTVKYIMIGREIEIPEAPKNPDGSLVDSLWGYRYMYHHFFDNIDFTDDRLVRSPFFYNKFDYYFKNIVVQIPDSMVSALSLWLPKFEASKEQFKMVCQKLTYDMLTSKQMCMDKAFVYIIQNFHDKGKVTWLKPEQLNDLTDRGKEMAPCVCNVPASPLTLPDSNMQWRSLYNLKTDYTILIFWSPDCGHCKKAMPEFVSMMKKFSGKSVSLYSVSQEHTPEWKKFIRENHMEDFVNVAVPLDVYEKTNPIAHEYVQQGLTDYKSLNYRNYYDIETTPRIYLLDKDKMIVAKHLDPENMEKFLNLFLTEKIK